MLLVVHVANVDSHRVRLGMGIGVVFLIVIWVMGESVSVPSVVVMSIETVLVEAGYAICTDRGRI